MTLDLVDKIKQQLAPHLFKVANFAIFQSVWALCVIGRDQTLYIAGILLVVHFVLSPSRLADAGLMTGVAALGIGFDYLLMLVGVFSFAGGVFPAWLAVLWLAFALTLNHSMAWLPKQRLVLQILLGSVGGASSYIGGYFLGAVDFGYSVAISTAILCLVWALALPLYCKAQRLIDRHAQTSL